MTDGKIAFLVPGQNAAPERRAEFDLLDLVRGQDAADFKLIITRSGDDWHLELSASVEGLTVYEGTLFGDGASFAEAWEHVVPGWAVDLAHGDDAQSGSAEPTCGDSQPSQHQSGDLQPGSAEPVEIARDHVADLIADLENEHEVMCGRPLEDAKWKIEVPVVHLRALIAGPGTTASVVKRETLTTHQQILLDTLREHRVASLASE